ncbi:winged helix-turn-helix transcriptional regulator [Oscillibacter ruminantium]|nr:helix-turn-helix domain-containing protein [Oscillibacter valericigenes]
MKLRKNYTCPLELVHDIVRGKWKTILIFQLRNGRCSFSELERAIAGISQKMLLEQLGELRRFGLVDKVSASGFPLRVEYFLTERGKKMLSSVAIMQEIGTDYLTEQNGADASGEPTVCTDGDPTKK